MKINILFLKTNVGFNKAYEKRLEKIIRNTAEEAAKILNLKGNIINFTVYPCKKFSDGWTRAKDWIMFSIPKNYSKSNLIGLVCHEMHHIKTDHCFYSKRKTFLETLFFEGLAIAFQIERSKRIPQYARYNSGLLRKWLPVLKKQNLLSRDYNYYEWFWGQGKKPKFLGYKLGRYLVEQIRKNFPDLTVPDLTRKKVRELFKLSTWKRK